VAPVRLLLVAAFESRYGVKGGILDEIDNADNTSGAADCRIIAARFAPLPTNEPSPKKHDRKLADRPQQEGAT
jgi:hypothetical protein